MSMSEAFVPRTTEPDDAPAAAEPGPGAPGTPLSEEPDILPDAADQSDDAAESSTDGAAVQDPPFRTPVPGESLSPDELDERH
jgi:hypothetical protein